MQNRIFSIYFFRKKNPIFMNFAGGEIKTGAFQIQFFFFKIGLSCMEVKAMRNDPQPSKAV